MVVNAVPWPLLAECLGVSHPHMGYFCVETTVNSRLASPMCVSILHRSVSKDLGDLSRTEEAQSCLPLPVTHVLS